MNLFDIILNIDTLENPIRYVLYDLEYGEVRKDNFWSKTIALYLNICKHVEHVRTAVCVNQQGSILWQPQLHNLTMNQPHFQVF